MSNRILTPPMSLDSIRARKFFRLAERAGRGELVKQYKEAYKAVGDALKSNEKLRRKIGECVTEGDLLNYMEYKAPDEAKKIFRQFIMANSLLQRACRDRIGELMSEDIEDWQEEAKTIDKQLLAEDEGKELSETKKEKDTADVKDALDKFKETHSLEDGADVLKAMQNNEDVDKHKAQVLKNRKEQTKEETKYMKEKLLKDTAEKEKEKRENEEAYYAGKDIKRKEVEEDIRFHKKREEPKTMQSFTDEIERRLEDE